MAAPIALIADALADMTPDQKKYVSSFLAGTSVGAILATLWAHYIGEKSLFVALLIYIAIDCIWTLLLERERIRIKHFLKETKNFLYASVMIPVILGWFAIAWMYWEWLIWWDGIDCDDMNSSAD